MLVTNQVAGKLGFNRQAPVAQMPGCPGGTPQLANGRGARCDPRCPLAPCGQRRVLQMWPPPLFTCCARRRILPCSSNVTGP